MKIFLLHGNSQTTTSWSGGTTTELFITPDGATFADRNFDFRVSTAEVLAKTSEFSSLPGYNRKLMVLRGGIEIAHKDHHTKKLEAQEQDEFSGDWETTSVGQCIDFNLICSSKASGKMKAHEMVKPDAVEVKSNDSFLFFYCVVGHMDVRVGAKNFILQSTDFLIIRDPRGVEIEITTLTNAYFVETKVNV
ncbi:MAG: HutD family protein [Crocinitomicaceae bacterium]